MKGIVEYNNASPRKGVHIQIQTDGLGNFYEMVRDGESLIDLINRYYLKYGLRFLEKLNGSFSLAIEDYERNEFILVRDKLGKTPVYYASYNKRILWGNLINDILSQYDFHATVNHKVIHEYLSFRYISGRNTLFNGIYEVLPGHYINVNLKDGSIEEKCYWDIPYPHRSEILKAEETMIASELEQSLINSIKRNFSDTTLRHGILSSGGVDSSLIVALASKFIHEQIPTFFIGFEGYNGDRSKDAEMVADRYHAIHTNYYIDSEQYAAGILDAIRVHEEPLNHPGHVGRVLFNKYMSGMVDALHMGEGVDTMFCGSNTYPLLKYGYKYNPFRYVSRKLISLINADIIPSNLRRYYKKIYDVFVLEPSDYMILSMAESDYNAVNKLLHKKSDMSYLSYYKNLASDCNRSNVLDKYLYLNQHPFMVEVLNSEAKYGHEYGIINSYPFLDEKLIEFANSIPFRLRTKGFTGKYIIKKLAESYFPKQFVYKRKEGFGVPLGNFFSYPNGMGRYYDLLLDQKTKERGVFNPRELEILVNEHRTNKVPHNTYEGVLWTAINLELWFRIYIDKSKEN
jgi:asparagine synthase (glutamine-hydrolysing)